MCPEIHLDQDPDQAIEEEAEAEEDHLLAQAHQEDQDPAPTLPDIINLRRAEEALPVNLAQEGKFSICF